MARGVNKVILVGNLGQDPEVRFFPQGGAVCNVTVATTDSWKDKQSGEQKEVTEWHRVSFNNRLAEIAGEYLRKGSKIYVEGSLRTRKWQNQQGQDQYTTEIRATEMQMLDSRGGDNAGAAQQGGGFQNQRPQQQAAPAQQSQQQGGYQQSGGFQQQQPAQQQNQQGGFQQPANKPAQGQQPQGAPDFSFDDDIPF